MALADPVNVSDIERGGVVLGMGVVSLLAQADPSIGAIINSVIQVGAVGGILLWITFVDIPARNKSAETREAAANAAAREREAIWKDQLVAERLTSQAREELFRASLDKMSAALGAIGSTQSSLASALDQLGDEMKEERRSRKS